MTTMTLSRLPTVPAVMPKAEPMFKSAHAALVFALNYSMQQYDRPLMNRIAAGPAPESHNGLSGLDGAAQAGMIRAELACLVPLHQAVLVASVAHQKMICECRAVCCAGWKVNSEWSEAINELTTVAAAAALAGCISNGRLRSALIQRLLGAKVTWAALAEQHGVNENTVRAHAGKLKDWLFGSPTRPGLHPLASNAISARLRRCGWIGGPSE